MDNFEGVVNHKICNFFFQHYKNFKPNKKFNKIRTYLKQNKQNKQKIEIIKEIIRKELK